MSERLGSSEPSVRWSNRACGDENGTISIEHDECSVLIGKPAKSCERNYSVRPNHDESLETVSHTRKTSLAAIRTNSVLNR
ncbi:MAG: hypothetical protein WAN72_02485 [Candidatus Acidiferrales bacterium]